MPVVTPGQMADETAASPARTAILFGPERSGLETDDVALARAILTVPIVLYQRATPAAGALRELSWWHWTGGLLGAYFIATAAFAGPKVGALLFMALVLAGQLGMALLLDHQGWVGFREAPVSLGKVAGLAMVLLGVWMIRRG